MCFLSVVEKCSECFLGVVDVFLTCFLGFVENVQILRAFHGDLKMDENVVNNILKVIACTRVNNPLTRSYFLVFLGSPSNAVRISQHPRKPKMSLEMLFKCCSNVFENVVVVLLCYVRVVVVSCTRCFLDVLAIPGGV